MMTMTTKNTTVATILNQANISQESPEHTVLEEIEEAAEAVAVEEEIVVIIEVAVAAEEAVEAAEEATRVTDPEKDLLVMIEAPEKIRDLCKANLPMRCCQSLRRLMEQ